MDFLIGSTGFVGSNLAAQHAFGGQFHSTDVENAFGKRPELLVYAALPAEMFLANKDPAADLRRAEQAMENIRAIGPKACVLVSSIAVYPDTHGMDEDSPIDPGQLSAYGANRLALERWVEENVEDHLVLRLPAIFGKGLKKNFLYDYIHRIPAMLSEAKMAELGEREPALSRYYLRQPNGFYRCRPLAPEEERLLKEKFSALGFNALAFTDSRSTYQFYALKRLWEHISLARELGLRRLNLTAPPLSAGELYRFLCGDAFENHLAKPPYSYDLRSRHAELFGGRDGYTLTREQELEDIAAFVRAEGGVCR